MGAGKGGETPPVNVFPLTFNIQGSYGTNSPKHRSRGQSGEQRFYNSPRGNQDKHQGNYLL